MVAPMGPGGTVSAPGGRHVSAWWVNAIAAVLASSGWPWVYPGCRPPQPPAPSALRSSERAAWLLSVRPSRSVVHFVVHQVGGWVGRRKKTPAPPLVEIRRLSIIGLILLFVITSSLCLYFTLNHLFCQISKRSKNYGKKIIIGYSYILPPKWGRNVRVTMIGAGWCFYPFSP